MSTTKTISTICGAFQKLCVTFLCLERKKKKSHYQTVFWNSYLLGRGHKVDGSVVIIIFLDETEGELVVDQEIVYIENQTGKESSHITSYSSERGWKRSIQAASCGSHYYRLLWQHKYRELHAMWYDQRNFQAIDWLTATSEIKMSVITSNDCNQGAQFSHQAENK